MFAKFFDMISNLRAAAHLEEADQPELVAPQVDAGVPEVGAPKVCALEVEAGEPGVVAPKVEARLGFPSFILSKLANSKLS